MQYHCSLFSLGQDDFTSLDRELAGKFAEKNKAVEFENTRFQQHNE
jgi:hypothetical protein